MKIDGRTVDAIAGLAKLELAPGERELYAAQLAGILDWMQELDRADTSALPAGAGEPAASDAAAADEPEVFSGREGMLRLAPRLEAGFVKVRAVME
jgi:aspartyl-tRNA(Asn)/glutamyl-tRNA(Gln) amidotransferase subunit C